MTWATIGRALRLAFYLRVPLTFLVLLAGLGPISQFTGAHALLGNLFDLQSDDGAVALNVFLVSLGSFLLAFSAVTSLNLTLCYGTQRFFDKSGAADSSEFQLHQSRPGTTFICGLAAALSLIVTAILRTEGGRPWTKIAASAAALVFAMAATLLAKMAQLLMTNPAVTPHPPPFLVFPAYRYQWLGGRLASLYCWPPERDSSFWAKLFRSAKEGGGHFFQWPLQIVEGAGQGYLVPVPGSNRTVIASGHVFAFSLFAIAFLAYLVTGLNKSRIFASPALVPGLAYLLLFLAVACWSFSALAFFLDRYRFPLFLGVMLLASLTASAPESDHFFAIETERTVERLAQAPAFPTPASYLSDRTRDGRHKRIVIVATPGGGIQAAAWTARVLAGLEQKFPPSDDGSGGFRNSVTMISAVSGGSLGAMIYAASFAHSVDPSCVPKNAMRSAIDEAAWGWTSPDFWHTLFPWFRRNLRIDRGWAVEQKWAVVNHLSPEPRNLAPLDNADTCDAFKRVGASDSESDDTYISDWVKEGATLPALVFNSTLVESGAHVVFSTTRFPFPKDPRGIVNFYDLYSARHSHFDVRVTTAARLSASFPYVAPAARPIGLDNLYAPDFHFVDGGYYDNLGIDSAIGWLDAAFPEKAVANSMDKADVTDILILQIQHFNATAEAQSSRDGWGFQLFAPLKGLLSMWNIAPVHRDQNELGLFMTNFNNRAKPSPHIRTATIPYCGVNYTSRMPRGMADLCAVASSAQINSESDDGKKPGANCADQPLSWKLSQTQKKCIELTWNRFVTADKNPEMAKIKDFLDGR